MPLTLATAGEISDSHLPPDELVFVCGLRRARAHRHSHDKHTRTPRRARRAQQQQQRTQNNRPPVRLALPDVHAAAAYVSNLDAEVERRVSIKLGEAL